MSFAISKLFWAVAAPGNALVILLAAGTALLFTRRAHRAGRILVAAAALGFLAITYLPVGTLLTLILEERFQRPAALPERVDGIIVLGGYVNPPLAAERDEPSVNEAAERLLAFAELVRRYPEAKAVATGGSGRLFAQSIKEDAAVRGALRQAGIDPACVIFENESRNTWENALFSRRLAAPQPGETWVLVTSAIHMPRSVGIFRRIGWEVVPYPVDYRTRPGGGSPLRFEFDKGLALVNDAVREWVGLVSYRLMGRTDSLLPGV